MLYLLLHTTTNLVDSFKFILGFRQTITKYTPLIEAWKKINHANIVQLKDVFITKAFNDSCK